MVSLTLGACGGATAPGVTDGTYRALVPTAEQFTVGSSDDIPGGFAPLRDDGIDEVEVLVMDDQATFRLDGDAPITREVSERRTVRDSEGSGPFKGTKEVLVLGAEPLVLGGLTIEEPVIWPGSFENSPVITLKPADPDERNWSGRPSISTSQSGTGVSSSVQAGLVAQGIPCTPRPAERSSPRSEGPLVLPGK